MIETVRDLIKTLENFDPAAPITGIVSTEKPGCLRSMVDTKTINVGSSDSAVHISFGEDTLDTIRKDKVSPWRT